MLVESHANLHHSDFADDLSDVALRSKAAGVETIVNICCKMEEFERVLTLSLSNINTWCTIGVHPHYAAEHQWLAVETLVEKSNHEKVIAIGETGLDYHYDFSPRDVQIANFQRHIEAAKTTKLPIVIHTREADADMMEILSCEYKKQSFRFVLHSYTSGAELAKLGSGLGGYFSVNGISTFKNAQSVRDIIKEHMPDDRIMLETDCPYLAPIPHRGKRNEPSYLPLIRDQLASIKGWSAAEAELLTSQAFFDLFTRARRP